MSMTSSPSPARRRKGPSRPLLIAGAVVLVLVLAFGAWLMRPKPPTDPYRTAAVERGDIVRSVSASGTLQALVTVQVGSQLSGQVKQVLVDFNTPVKKGQVLAIVDPSTFESRAAQGAADLSAQQASLVQQQASLQQAQAELNLQQANYERSKTLTEKGWLAQSALDQAEAAYKKAQASIGVSQAQINSQRARINQSRASLNANQLDVSRTRIVSPIDGVVVSRAVDPGQTVAASLQVSTLFQIAQDLSKLQVKILVDEADIGQLREGQRVDFTVDAFPDETFNGVVTQVRKQPETQQNVVAYAVIAEADNRGGRLLPGMTANATIVVAQQRNVLKAPSAALRWRPADQPLPTQRQGGGGGGFGGGFGPGGGFGGPPGGGFGGPPGGGFGGPPGGGGGGGGAGQGGRAGGFGGQGGNQRVYADLQLDAGQKAKADAIFAASRAKIQAAMQGAAPGAGQGGGDPQARRKAFQEANNQAYDQLAPLLKPDQKVKLAAFRARQAEFAAGRGGGRMQRGTLWVLDKKGKPSQISVRIGGTDGSFTEVQGADVKDGEEVIVGGGPKAPARPIMGGGIPGAGGGPPGGGQLRRIGG